MGFGGACGTAASVPACPAAQQDHDVAGFGPLAHDVLCRRGADDCADLHPFGRVAGMVEFMDIAGRQADLVAVGAVARSCSRNDLALGQLALHRLLNGRQRICRAC